MLCRIQPPQHRAVAHRSCLCASGSKDERPDEQGMAHLVEHVTFLGSTKRENLHGTGARSNAYTDFHHTVFHVHAPQKSMAWGQTPLLPKVDLMPGMPF